MMLTLSSQNSFNRHRFYKVSKKKSEEANRSDYHEWSISEQLRHHPNVLQVVGLCPSFKHHLYKGIGTTALITPLQENGSLEDFLSNKGDFAQLRNVLREFPIQNAVD